MKSYYKRFTEGIYVRVTPEMRAFLEHSAKESNRKLTEFIRDILTDYQEKQKTGKGD